MNKPSNNQEFAIQPVILDKRLLQAYEKAAYLKGKRLRCDICARDFNVGDTLASTFTNWGGQRGGNPLTCGSCLNIPREQRLEIWKLKGDDKVVSDFVMKMVLKV